MPKRVGFLYEKMLDKGHIKQTILTASKKKKKRWDVKLVLNDLDAYVDKVYQILVDQSYIPTTPKEKIIYDPSSGKHRAIAVQPFFPDGIIQQLIVQAIEPVIMRRMYKHSYASIPKRGTHAALRYAKRMVQRHRKNCKYAAELDVEKFYPTIPQFRVMEALERKIKDRRMLQIIAVTINCYPLGQRYAVKNNLSPSEIVGNTVGLHIGFYIDQWLANFYLESTDRLILQQKGVRGYYRYMDNMQLFGNRKRQLHKAIRMIAQMLTSLGLKLKSTWQVFPLDKRLLQTVGYRVGRDFVLLRKRNFLRLTRQCRRIRRKGMKPATARSILSRIGQLRYCNSRTIFQKYIDPIGVDNLKSIVRFDAVSTARIKTQTT